MGVRIPPSALPKRAMGALSLVISSWVILFFIFVGLGIFIRRLFGVKTLDVEKLLESFWVGWAFTIFFLQLWHLFFRIDWHTFVLVCIFGLVSLLWNYKELQCLVNTSSSKSWILYIISLLTFLWLAYRATLPPLHYDSGLYHFNSIRWATSFPIVPGLGNLHSRLALNSSYFLYMAMLEVGPWVRKSHNLANGLLPFVLSLQIYISTLKFFKNNQDLRLYQIFNILILPPVLNLVDISSPSTDFPIFILAIVLFTQLMTFLDDSKKDKREAGWTIFSITTLAVVGIIIKFTFLIFGATSLFIALIVWFIKRGYRNKATYSYKKMFIFLIVSIAGGLIPWMLRGVILSGYIAYPIPWGSFPVEWRIPYESVVNMKNGIQGWGRTPVIHWSKVLNNWQWLKPWAFRTFRRHDIMIALSLALIGCFSVLLFRVTKKHYPEGRKLIWLCLLPPAVSLIFWFITAPDPRFGNVFFWLIGAGSITLAFGYIDNNRLKKITKLCIILFLSPFFVQIIPVNGKINFVKTIIRERNIAKAFQELHIRQHIIMESGGENGFYDIPSVELKTFTTDSGLVVYIPKEGEEDRCWDAPLPCAPYANPHLRLREKGNMRYGFIIDLK